MNTNSPVTHMEVGHLVSVETFETSSATVLDGLGLHIKRALTDVKNLTGET